MSNDTRALNIKYNEFTLTGGTDTYTPSSMQGLVQMNLISDQAFMIAEKGGSPDPAKNAYAADIEVIVPMRSEFAVKAAAAGTLTVIEYFA